MSDFTDVFRHSKNYFSANVAAKAVGVISLPVFTTILTTSEYGSYQLFVSYLALSSLILTLNFHGSVARYYYENTDDFQEFISISILGSFLIVLVFFVSITPFSNFIAKLANIPTTFIYLLFIKLITFCRSF